MPGTFPPPDAPPRHGYRGDGAPALGRPRGLTVALSRDAGSRGSLVAQAAGELLGWSVFDQEMLDFLGNDDPARADLWADVPAPARLWAEARVAELPAPLDPPLAEAARLTLALAARGDAVLIGRGAGFLLPAESTVHVHVVAPREQRVLFLAERLRLGRDEAEAEVDARDARRAELRAALGLGGDVGDWSGFDLVLNSHRLGVEGCAELIAQAVRIKQMPPKPEESAESA